jgi:hypothetical protein
MMRSFGASDREEEDWSSASDEYRNDHGYYHDYDSSSSEHDEESSTLYSGDSRDEEYRPHPKHRINNGLSGLVSSLRRRVGHGIPSVQSFSQVDLEEIVQNNLNSTPDKKKQFTRESTGRIAHCIEIFQDKCPDIRSQTCHRASSVILVIALIIWLNVMAFYHPPFVNDTLSSRDQSYALSVRERIHGQVQPPPPGHSKEDLDRIRQNKKSASGGIFFEAASDGFWNAVGGKKRGVEGLPPGCIPADWHTQSFPNCNDLHEINLRLMAPSRRRRFYGIIDDFNETSYVERPRYISSGMWRDVWSVTPRWVPGSYRSNERAVLKMMKPEHDVNSRNMDRHRRDAMVMERLTSSPNVVSIYGHCGNTVVTEIGAQTLDSVLLSGSGHATHNAVSRSTPLGRLLLARDAANGVAALHEVAGGPVIHADITAKQFLVDFEGRIKLNDFNRCRLMPHNNVTNEKCRIRIPSAPGLERSPEEYLLKEVDEKLDVYSLGNVLYSILTGTKPWRDEGSNAVKIKVRNGKKPHIDEAFRKDGTSDAAFAVLVNLAYELDPALRISAAALVDELDIVIEKEKANN